MAEVHEGGCVCGAVRYRVSEKPMRTGVCHCTFCQRRTGSAFGIGVYFRAEDVAFLRGGGELRTYEHHSDESHRWLKMQFCPNCGTTVSWTVEALPGLRAIGGGTFDDPNWLRIERHSWTRSRQRWLDLPTDVPHFERSSLPQR